MLWTVAIAIAAVLVWVKRRFHTVQAIFRDSRRPMDVTDLKGDNPAQKNLARLVLFYRSRMIIAFSLSETIAIFGLLLALTGDYASDQQSLSLISAGLLVYFFPSRAFFDELLNEYERREAQQSW